MRTEASLASATLADRASDRFDPRQGPPILQAALAYHRRGWSVLPRPSSAPERGDRDRGGRRPHAPDQTRDAKTGSPRRGSEAQVHAGLGRAGREGHRLPSTLPQTAVETGEAPHQREAPPLLAVVAGLRLRVGGGPCFLRRDHAGDLRPGMSVPGAEGSDREIRRGLPTRAPGQFLPRTSASERRRPILPETATRRARFWAYRTRTPGAGSGRWSRMRSSRP